MNGILKQEITKRFSLLNPLKVKKEPERRWRGRISPVETPYTDMFNKLKEYRKVLLPQERSLWSFCHSSMKKPVIHLN